MVIGRVGPTRLTLAAVARQVGLSPAALLQRFGSKRGLLLALAEAAVEAPGITTATVRAESPEDSSLAVLTRVLVRMGTALGGPDELANHFAMLQIDVSDPAFRQHVVASMGALTRTVSQLLEEAAGNAEIVHDDTDQLAEAVVSTWNGALITWAIFRQGPLESWLTTRLHAVIAPHLPSERPDCTAPAGRPPGHPPSGGRSRRK